MLIKKSSEMTNRSDVRHNLVLIFFYYICRCPACTKAVFAAEEKIAGGHKWHKSCFKCNICNKSLDSTLCNENEGKIYCKVCVCVVIEQYFDLIWCRLATAENWVQKVTVLVKELEH